MDKKALCDLGLNAACDIPAHTLVSIEFDPQQYGLRDEDRKTIGILRDLVAEYNREIPRNERKPITTPADAAKVLFPVLRDLDHEETWVIFVNMANYPIATKMICSGSLEQTVIDRRKIVKHALDLNATGVILAHNHPSGNPTPSKNDIRETDSIQSALGLFNINLVDHIIIANSKYYSFSNEESVEIP